MTILAKALRSTAALAIVAAASGAAFAEEYTITVWSGGTGDDSHYRVDAIEMAADLLEREAAVRGEELDITVEKQVWSGWDDFKQAVTLAAESGTAPNIIVSGHEDIGPWSQAGILRPIEDYVDFDAWPLNQLYDNLVDVSSYDGLIWGVPQDAESRPFFMSKAHLAEIGYSEDEIDALPGKIQSGEYTLYDMLDDVKTMQDEGVVEAGMGFAPRVNNGTDYWQFYQSFGGEMVDEETGKLVFDKQALTDMYQFFADAVEMGVTPATYLGGDWDVWHGNVAADAYGAWHGGTWHKSQWERQFGVDDFFGQMTFSLIPAGNENGEANTITHPLVYLISTTGSDDEAAISAELVAIASEPRINSLHAVESGHLAIGSAQADVPLYANDRWTTEATEQLLPYANPIPNNADFGIFWDAMYQGLEAAWTGTSSVEDAVNQAQSAVESGLGDGIIIR
ncbi:sugar ABC transporter substrate-binding protein [Devosia pacifica]|uniref:Sugar ABC transporter substrate-binding protein n=1 Tax=Devosia pacifica TaxID=1335967 RepID=A0A918S343_9HYPH|nr:extracellular solute-binding protein [Devosia pacifica]GHA21407.1 sugar ABC transporter substrate-binding protein [Devosia pacifica]